ncbi:universal stress protein [Allohahella sp. A8]|uniref:universal stress protein n=1 Tax=Allohahella sp. A8 TaxID=3141461 RepID=UPI003A81167D
MTLNTGSEVEMQQIIACIDGSSAVPAVCEYAAWASLRSQAPVMLLHVLDEAHYPEEPDLAGNIGLGSREHLLKELAELDQKRSRLALEHGHHLLDEAEARVQAVGVSDVHKRQRHGDLPESVLALEKETLLFVMGLRGENSAGQDRHIGSQLETVIRKVHRPVLLVPDQYEAPQSAMLAFDGSATAFRGVQLLADNPVFTNMPLHIVMVGAESTEHWAQLTRAKDLLSPLGGEIQLAIREGDVEQTLHTYQTEHDIDLMLIGAYGHSRIRQFLVGSTTTPC